MRVSATWVLCALVGGLILTSTAYGQAVTGLATNQTIVMDRNTVEQTQKEALAESIITREEVQSGRAFDPTFRADVKRALASLSISALEAQQSQVGLGTNVLGDTAADLVYTPLTPCRIIDTRPGSGGPGPIAAGGTQSFYVAGTLNFPAQGGKSGGCGVPVGATAAMINFVAVGAAAAGDVRVTPFGTAMPTASILNYAGGVSGLNLANGLAVALCNPATTTCTFDIVLQADASAINIVADVQGYFRRPSGTPNSPGIESSGTITAGVGSIYPAIGVNIGGATKCLVTVSPLVAYGAGVLAGQFALTYPTWRVNGTTTDHVFNPWCFLSAPASTGTYYTCTTAGVASPTGSASNTYDFGCSNNLGAYSGSAYCHATVVCLP